MADIKVERKGASIWPWILGLLVAALLVWALAGLFRDEEEVEELDSAPEVGAMLHLAPAWNDGGAPAVGAPSPPNYPVSA